MKAMLRKVVDGDLEYDCLMFVCPGCQEFGGSGLHMLPVNSEGLKKANWRWDENLEMPTLNPSILTHSGRNQANVCHSYLIEGVFQFLDDSTHSLANKHALMPDLPSWVLDEIWAPGETAD